MAKNPIVTIEMENGGKIVAELYPEVAPESVRNFISLANIKGEFKVNGVDNGLSHKRGVLSFARSQSYNSAGSQFFIMHADGDFLNGQYAAFGAVTEGLDVVDAIAAVKTDRNDRPAEDQRMKTVRVDTFGEEYGEPQKLKDPYGRF